MKTLMRGAGLRTACAAAVLLLLGLGGAASATTIKVHYDVGLGNRITIRGSKAPLSWTAGANATWTTGNIWTYTLANTVGDVDIKPLVNDATWSTGANYHVTAGATVDLYPFFGPAAGTLKRIDNFFSPQLNNSRSLILYLPPSYNANPYKRYPVLYMHDGQNIFDASTSFGGVEWRVDETANQLIGTGAMDEVIIVGIYNTSNRIAEYTPCCDAQYGGGSIDLYESFILNTVKPYIDQNYRTIPKKEDTALMGSSLGGLASFYIGRRHPEVFSKVGCMSSSFWWNNEYMVNVVVTSTTHVPVKFYIDTGTSNDALTETTDMKNALVADGYVQGNDLDSYVAQGGSHDEASWAARVNIPLTYLFPWGSTVY